MRLIDAVEEVYKSYDVVAPLCVHTYTKENGHNLFKGIGIIVPKMSGYAISPIDVDVYGEWLTMSLSDEIEGYEYEYDPIYNHSDIYAQLEGD